MSQATYKSFGLGSNPDFASVASLRSCIRCDLYYVCQFPCSVDTSKKI